ncbi:ATP-binding cassette domain-containing protein [Paenibacillus sp. LMG 31461]|uniref:ATP-binding cassette domain-containing protein n=1 Tax=Paenibacillus plantarum TaxID=2654975 RepID=A0ABX1XHZ4_9BACL|nr:ABC transporter ATP-binding protein [Paenibacillus plantarum]NOU67701.1 ATP-binding cassette domain-containing protein [Paenibacillus plantarum]
MRGKEIILNGVDKTYQTRTGNVQALSKVSLTIERSSFVSIVGPSGCGKSTLMNLIAGLDTPSEGTIMMNGEKVTGPTSGNAVVFQKDLLQEWRTILGNVLLPMEIHNITWLHRSGNKTNRARALELLASVGLKGFEDKYPNELSGGMRQRAAICRALIQEPKLLLMDEPFGALDALTREQMMYDLLKIAAEFGFTVLFITHSIEEAVFLSDRVLVMSERPGAIVKDIEIDLEKPRGIRTRSNPKFAQYVQNVREIFKNEGILSEV